MKILTKKEIKNTYSAIRNRSLLFQLLETANHHGLKTDIEMDVFRSRDDTYYVVTTDGVFFHAMVKIPDKPKYSDLSRISQYQMIDYIGNYKRRVINKAKQVYHYE